jgi:hypothetical protein
MTRAARVACSSGRTVAVSVCVSGSVVNSTPAVRTLTGVNVGVVDGLLGRLQPANIRMEVTRRVGSERMG